MWRLARPPLEPRAISFSTSCLKRQLLLQVSCSCLQSFRLSLLTIELTVCGMHACAADNSTRRDLLAAMLLDEERRGDFNKPQVIHQGFDAVALHCANHTLFGCVSSRVQLDSVPATIATPQTSFSKWLLASKASLACSF